MIILFEGGVVVRRKHLAVGIDIHPGSLGLLEKILHIPQVVAADENSGVVPHPDIHRGNLRIAVGGGVGLVEKGHGLHRLLSCLKHQPGHLIYGKIFGGGGQGGHEEVVNIAILVLQHRRMLRIGGDPLCPDGEQLL